MKDGDIPASYVSLSEAIFLLDSEMLPVSTML